MFRVIGIEPLCNELDAIEWPMVGDDGCVETSTVAMVFVVLVVTGAGDGNVEHAWAEACAVRVPVAALCAVAPGGITGTTHRTVMLIA